MSHASIWFDPAGDAPSSRPVTLALVGNAPERGDQRTAIDACDKVVRLNNAAGFEAGAGRKVTHLVLVNHGGQMGEWLEAPDFSERPVVSRTPRILFPFPARANNDGIGPDGRCWSAPARERLEAAGKQVSHLPPDTKPQASAALEVLASEPCPDPSTGLLVLFSLLKAAQSAPLEIHVFGFGFAGWEGHPWAAERAFVEAAAARGDLDFAPLEA